MTQNHNTQLSLRVAALVAVALLAWPSTASAQDVALEFEEFTLDNGLHVILHEDRSLPMVAVNLWYGVGSRDERKGRSGFAHLFEHLMFMGTRRAPSFDVLMESGGGSNNAWTAEDATVYHEIGPSNLLETLLWLEADRLASLDDEMTAEKLDIQRGVVRNERRQNYENAPYGALWLVVPELMYPEGHGYRHPTIGSHADLEAATVDDVTSFFREYYVARNASLVVAGDIDRAATRAMIERLFGSLPAGAEPRLAAPPAEPPRIEAQRRELEDDVQLARIVYVWHSPAFYQPGDAEMDITSYLLTRSKTSRLYESLVYDKQIAADVVSYQYSMGWSSLFVIEVTAAPGAALVEVEAALEAELESLRASGPTDDEVERARNNIEAGFVRQMQSLESRAELLNRYRFYAGRADYLAEDLARYRSASPQSVHAQLRETLDPARRLTVVIKPSAQAAAREDAP